MAYGRSQEEEQEAKDQQNQTYDDAKNSDRQNEEREKSHRENGLYDDNGNRIA